MLNIDDRTEAYRDLVTDNAPREEFYELGRREGVRFAFGKTAELLRREAALIGINRFAKRLLKIASVLADFANRVE